MHTDLDRSLERLTGSEETRAKLTGFGTTKQGQALTRQHREQLADEIASNRAHPAIRERPVWKAIRGSRDAVLAPRLLVAGITVCAADDLGTDSDGQKNFLNQALWIGRNLGVVRDRDLAVKVGTWGINRLLSLPIFALGPGDVLELVLTERLDALLDDVLLHSIKTNPLLTPSATAPWTQVRTGGLPAGHWAQPPLIKDHNKAIENAARKAIGTGRMQPLLDAVNTLQPVEFSINLPVLHFLRRMGPPPLPPAPDKSKLKPGQYWYAKKKYSEALAQVTDWELIVTTAEAMGERFPVALQIDFRGRIYPIPHFNFTRDDRVRGLFLFADGKPIGVEGLKWLKAHVAARADGVAWSNHTKLRLSELNFEERIKWTDDNSELLLKIGRAVLDGDDPAKLNWALMRRPDKFKAYMPGLKPPKQRPIKERFQFLAACAELAQAWDNPDFITRLPLTFDASCSGLQHLCAITRDEKGGRYVNLTPSEVADDFYRRVAFKTYMAEQSRLDAWCKDKTGVSVELAKRLSFISSMKTPFDRDPFKQPAMSYFYGARPGGFNKDGEAFGMTKQVIAAGVIRGAKKLARAIYANIEDMLPRPKAVRNWLEKLAGLAAEKEKPLRWLTPLGLSVINIYQPMDIKHMSVRVNDRKRQVNVVVGDNGIRGKKAKNAVTANFIHSVDAAHLQLVALAAAKEDIEMVSVHDCFGTIAPHAGRLNEIIRDELIDLHKRYNWLAHVWVSAKRDLPGVPLPSLPEIGTLKLEQVRNSFAAYR
jgi:DNA-directed RNA polymerase